MEARGYENTPASDPEHLPTASSAATLFGLFPTSPEAAFSDPSTTLAWDTGVMHSFLPQQSVLPSNHLQNEASVQPSQLLQCLPSTPNYMEGIRTSPSFELDQTSGTCTASFQRNARLVGPEDLLPSVSHILELLDIFFNCYHNYLPCIHRKTLSERVKSRLESAQSSPLLWAVLAVAAPAHPNPHIQALQGRWLAKARSTFDTNLNSSTFPTQTLQAAVFIIFQAYISADLTDAWFFLENPVDLHICLELIRLIAPVASVLCLWHLHRAMLSK